MNGFLRRLHARVGDLWWYSAMIFLACRTGDAIQAFIGLWLVPKYVGPQELGAVLPLQQLTSFLTVPLAIVAVVFSKYVNTYATRGEFGKVRGFIRDVFAVSLALFLACIAGAYFCMPFFYERLRIASGSLTALILLCGLVTNLGTVIGSAQQGLKRFKTMSVMTLVSAPIRLVTLLVAMPIRPLSGYILGQTTPGLTTSVLSLFDLRRALRPYAPDPAWRRDLPEILRYLWPIAIYTALATFLGTIQSTVYRQRLPELESSAYYMLSRFSELAGYAGSALMMILVPMASEAHESGRENRALLRRSVTAMLAISAVLALAFHFLAAPLLALNETWATYRPYAELLLPLTLTVGVGTAITAMVNYEIACRRFSSAAAITLGNSLWTILLVSLTGYEFFRGLLPDAFVDALGSLRFARLSVLAWAGLAVSVVQMVVLAVIAARRPAPSAR